MPIGFKQKPGKEYAEAFLIGKLVKLIASGTSVLGVLQGIDDNNFYLRPFLDYEGTFVNGKREDVAVIRDAVLPVPREHVIAPCLQREGYMEEIVDGLQRIVDENKSCREKEHERS